MQMQRKAGARAGFFSEAVLESGQVALDQNGHVGHDVGVQSDLDRVLADGLQVAVGQADLGLFDREVSFFRPSAMSPLVTEPNRRPSTPAFWTIFSW